MNFKESRKIFYFIDFWLPE